MTSANFGLTDGREAPAELNLNPVYAVDISSIFWFCNAHIYDAEKTEEWKNPHGGFGVCFFLNDVSVYWESMVHFILESSSGVIFLLLSEKMSLLQILYIVLVT